MNLVQRVWGQCSGIDGFLLMPCKKGSTTSPWVAELIVKNSLLGMTNTASMVVLISKNNVRYILCNSEKSMQAIRKIYKEPTTRVWSRESKQEEEEYEMVLEKEVANMGKIGLFRQEGACEFARASLTSAIHAKKENLTHILEKVLLSKSDLDVKEMTQMAVRIEKFIYESLIPELLTHIQAAGWTNKQNFELCLGGLVDPVMEDFNARPSWNPFVASGGLKTDLLKSKDLTPGVTQLQDGDALVIGAAFRSRQNNFGLLIRTFTVARDPGMTAALHCIYKIRSSLLSLLKPGAILSEVCKNVDTEVAQYRHLRGKAPKSYGHQVMMNLVEPESEAQINLSCNASVKVDTYYFLFLDFCGLEMDNSGRRQTLCLGDLVRVEKNGAVLLTSGKSEQDAVLLPSTDSQQAPSTPPAPPSTSSGPETASSSNDTPYRGGAQRVGRQPRY